MNILFICPVFQPYCPVAATRPPHFARYLLDQGHRVRVLAAENLRHPALTEPNMSKDLISYVPMWHPIDVASKTLNAMRPWRRKPQPDSEPKATNAPASSVADVVAVSPLRAWAYDAFDYTFNYPDAYLGWIKNAKAEGASLIEAERPDVIFSTAPPHSASVVAAHLSHTYGVPWVCEYRDLWMAHPYHTPNPVRAFFERRLENRVAAQANAFVAVSREAQESLAQQFSKPAILARNGFLGGDFPADHAAAALDKERLVIVYAGSIYPKTRDPSLLFEAIAQLPEDTQNRLDVRFYTENPGTVLDLAQRYNVTGSVSFHPLVPHADILNILRGADVLLLLRWDDPREDGIIAGKVFEYIGARRPVLSVGRTQGEVAEIFTGRAETLLSRTPAEITDQLGRWVAQKPFGVGTLPDVPDTPEFTADAYERAGEFAKIQQLLEDKCRAEKVSQT